jgi:hypothetical protein
MMTIDRMTFTAVRLRSGRWSGRCRELPNLRAGTKSSKIAAIDAIIDAARDELAEMPTPSPRRALPRAEQ